MTVKFGSKVGSCSRTGPCKIPAEGIIFHANKYSANYNNLSCAKRGILMEDFVREEGYVIYSYFDVCKKLQEMLIFAMGKTECALKCTRSARHGAAGKAIRTILPHFLNQLPSTRRTSIRGFRYTSLIKSYPGSHVCHPFPRDDVSSSAHCLHSHHIDLHHSLPLPDGISHRPLNVRGPISPSNPARCYPLHQGATRYINVW